MSIQIGKAINSILTGDSTIYGYVAKKIYPLILPENTALPAVVYERTFDVEYTRDGAAIASSSVDLTVLSENYLETINIAQAIYNKLNFFNGTIAGVQILDCRLTGAAETYAENSFIQKLSFELKSI